jgi:nucleotide-binding universal stress UspA family protein
MSIAKIIAPLTGAPRDHAVTAAALAAARLFNAHVSALFVHPDPRLSIPYMGVPLSPAVVQEVVETAEEIHHEAAREAKSVFLKAVTASGFSMVDKLQKSDCVTCSYHEKEGLFPDVVARAARLADLVVFGPFAATDGPDVGQAFVDTLTRTERPVLLCSRVPEGFASRIAIAWDGSAAAAHAVSASLPFLARAQSVDILHVHEASADERQLSAHFPELEEYLDLHGISASCTHVPRAAKSAGEALLEQAAANKSDLLVMGGYGHSHLRESLFGGVTTHVRWNADLPVLMVH